MEDGGTAIDISSANCKEWLANLYTVCECYLYQIEEGKFWHDRLYQEFGRWILQMAGVLARYVVKEVRGIYPLSFQQFQLFFQQFPQLSRVQPLYFRQVWGQRELLQVHR